MKVCRKGIHKYKLIKGSKTGYIKCKKIQRRKHDKLRYKNPLRRLQMEKAKLKHYRTIRKPYTQYKKNVCEKCGFLPINQIQLDVDHIDGNHKNNNIENLRTLCANCHRLKTYINNESSYK